MKVPASFKQKLSYYPNKKDPKITLSTVRLPGLSLFPVRPHLHSFETCVFSEDGSEILERYDSELLAFIGHKKWEKYIDKLDDSDFIDALFEIENSIGEYNGKEEKEENFR